MADNISRSSFIPKEAPGLVPGRVRRRRKFFVFGFISTVFLLGSIGLAVFSYIIQGTSITQLEKAKESLNENSSLFKEESILEVRDFDKRTQVAHMLIDNHISPLKVFKALEENIQNKVQLVDFSFAYEPGDEILLTISGGTETFKTLALQERQFNSSSILKDVFFDQLGTSQISNTDDSLDPNAANATSEVTFTFSGTLNIEDLLYSADTPVVETVPVTPEPVVSEQDQNPDVPIADSNVTTE